jgi:hypothetical protein
MSALRMRAILVALVQRVDLCPDEVIIQLRPRRLAALLEDRLTAASPGPVDDQPTLPLSDRRSCAASGKDVRMVIAHTDPLAPPVKPDPSLIEAIVNAQGFNEQLLHSGASKFADLARARNCTGIITVRFSASPISLPTSPPPFSTGDSLLP